MSSSLFINYLVIQSYVMKPIHSAVKQTINIVNTGSYQLAYTLYQITVSQCSCITSVPVLSLLHHCQSVELHHQCVCTGSLPLTKASLQAQI